MNRSSFSAEEGAMHDADLDSSVPDWLIEYPDALALFETLGIDYSCGGKSLESACVERGLDPREIVRLVKKEHLG